MTRVWPTTRPDLHQRASDQRKSLALYAESAIRPVVLREIRRRTLSSPPTTTTGFHTRPMAAFTDARHPPASISTRVFGASWRQPTVPSAPTRPVILRPFAEDAETSLAKPRLAEACHSIVRANLDAAAVRARRKSRTPSTS